MTPPDTSAPLRIFEGVDVQRDVMVPMRDGVRLAADIYRPAGATGPLPVLLERTPYGKRETNHADRTAADPTPKPKPEIAAAFARAGYVYVLQDCRGRFASEGEFAKYVNEGEDGVDTLAWILAQPWCDGAVGTLGLSYGAHVQAAMAAYDPPGLKAMFLDSGGFSSAYHSGIRQGGAFELKQLTWAVKHARLSPKTARDPARREALEREDIRRWIGVNPWRRGASPVSAAPEYEDYVLEQWVNETFGAFWRRPGLYAAGAYAAFVDAPQVHMSSWYDPYALTATENYQGLSKIKRGPVKLVLGPWTHGQRSVSYAGDVDFSPAAVLDGALAPDYLALRRAWFDRHLKGREAPDYLSAPVKLFVMGGGSGRRTLEGRLDHGGAWRDASDWPLPEAVPTAFHLCADGGLRVEAPNEAGLRAWRHDPHDPVPTIGGAIASGAPLMEAGAFDQRESERVFGAKVPGRPLADREDVLVFQTEPLEADVEVIGPISARLFVSSSAVDTDIMFKLIDVYPPSEDWPEGFAMNLTHGVLRLRFRESFETPVPMSPGEIYEVAVAGFPTANRFAKGHRIRLDIASSNFPHFDVNPNTGAPAGEASDPVVAENRVHLGPATPSCVVLPVVPIGRV
ncbi:MAG: CocE/NonD family hydrolase [Phenylobacterium sp.]|uniref:CocE/NonD family hydrolase n=1 Tax=Phenylobacterium sp. TaxID=1871053 RepID=UPI003919E477